MSCADILHDLSITNDPKTFDGFRFYRERQKQGESTRHQFATTDGDNLHFGHGKYACPGRFFASNEIKMILAHFLLKYDMKFPSDQGRPDNLTAHEYIFPDANEIVLIRDRQAGGSSGLA